MAQLPNRSGTATRVTGTGVTQITSANAALVGILCCNTATGGIIQVFAGLTATATAASGSAGKFLTGIITFASGSVATYIDVPAYASGGMLINIGAAANPDLTLYWNPA